MRQFKTVLKFEYTNYIKSKSFLITTGIIILIMLIAGNIPRYKDILSSFGFFGSDEPSIYEPGQSQSNAAPEPGQNGDLKKAAVMASQDIYTAEVLALYYGQYNWVFVTDMSNIESQIENNELEFAVKIDGLNYTLYQRGTNLMSSGSLSAGISEMILKVHQIGALAETGIPQEEIIDILYAHPSGETIIVGKDISRSFWMGYIMLFLLYFSIIVYGQYVSMSVITEKTSKAMELLVTSAKPMALMFGKVIGTGLAGLTQFGLFVASAFLVLKLNLDGWNETSPMIGQIVDMSLSSGMFLYAVIFFLLGFFTFAFLYAAFGSTVSRLEDANSVVMFPVLLFVAAFMVAMTGMSTPEATHIKICSYVPFLSPMVMFMRICVTDISVIEVIISIALNILYLLVVGYISTKIYRVGIMLYGNTPKLKDLIRYVKES